MSVWDVPPLYADYMKRWRLKKEEKMKDFVKAFAWGFVGAIVFTFLFMTFTGCGDMPTPTNVTTPRVGGESYTMQRAYTSIDDLQGRIDTVNADGASAWIRNVGTQALDVHLVSRKFESPGGSAQSVINVDWTRLEPGASTRLFVRVGECKTEIELARGNEAVARAWGALNYIDVAYYGSIASCGFDTCPANAPYLHPDGACHTGPYHPPTTPEEPPVDNDDDNSPPPPDNDDGGPVIEPVPDPIPDPSPEPEHGACYYEVSGPKALKEFVCLVNGGQWSSHDGSDHCVFPFPGISNNKFNLAPGLSDEDCLRKQDLR